jgi:hypothetical protein
MNVNRTMQRLADVAAAAEKKLRMRRFSWRRKFNAGPYMHADDKRLRLVARRVGAMLPVVEAFIDRLDDFANQNTPRGSVEGFSIEALAAHWSLPNEDVLARIYAELETPEIGWIDQDFIVDFWARNPDTEDATSAQRQARSRAFKKALTEIARQARLGFIDEVERRLRETKLYALKERARWGLDDWRAELRDILQLSTEEVLSRCDTVTVTTRSDQTVSKTGNSVDNVAAAASSESPGLSEGQAGAVAIDPQIKAELWLCTQGKRIVIERLDVNATLADTRLERWLRDVSGDHAALAEIIAAADKADYVAARFHNLIVDQIRRHISRVAGLQLPLMPPNPSKVRADQAAEQPTGELAVALTRLEDGRKRRGGHG